MACLYTSGTDGGAIGVYVRGVQIWQCLILWMPCMQVIRGDAFFGSDNGLADNPDTYELVKAYAADNELFLQRFSAAFFKLSWLGVNSSVPQLGL